jgi:hypothetical protein
MLLNGVENAKLIVLNIVVIPIIKISIDFVKNKYKFHTLNLVFWISMHLVALYFLLYLLSH